MTADWQADTELPRNLLDDDFNENSTELPPSRRATESTPMAYLVAKHKLSMVFGLVLDHTSSTRLSSYEEVMRLDNLLQEAHDSIPPSLQMRPVTSSITDPPGLILRRLNLDLLFYKARCMLHRKYLVPARSNPQFSYSRESCINAALAILQYQSVINQEVRPEASYTGTDLWCLP
jgi:hypothetical protein